MERVARAVRPISTAPEEDVLIILRRALFAWLIADGDMHLKNLALLKIADPGDDTFNSVRMAPLYDAVTTRLFPGLKHDRMALKLNGKDDRLRAKDLKTFASTARVKATDADTAVEGLLDKVGRAIEQISLPPLAEYGPNGKQLAAQMLELVRSRVTNF